MDAFEHVVAEVFWGLGYWVRTSVKVDLSKAEKVEIGLPTMPRPEIDLVAYHAGSGCILALECKSYLDSRGITYAEVCGDADSKTYKLFRREKMRDVVLRRLTEQLIEQGLCPPGITVQLGMIAGKISVGDEPRLAALFEHHDWFFKGPSWLKAELEKLASTSYENQISSVVAKLLLR